ncbi:Pentatricopeptide repeat-containing protein [Platanthera guangdongensis]|uniref:Pentatricopeptide repeat-containing protein n=1 Tax=Platanthera guangdongensis TaxID=2320717 RepID=A0ABR2MJL2_9ASPA
MVEEAFSYFKSMKIEHYGCLVHTLGWAGFIKKAKNLVERMPTEPDGIIWGSLLQSSRVHGNAEVGDEAAAQLMVLDQRDSSGHVILSNALPRDRDFSGSAADGEISDGLQHD